MTVKITDNGDGTLNVTPEYSAGNKAVFTNRYADASTELTGTKSLTGRAFKLGDKWTFNIEALTKEPSGNGMPCGGTIPLADPEEMTWRFFVRMPGTAKSAEETVRALFPEAVFAELADPAGMCAFVTGVMSEKEFSEKAAGLPADLRTMRVLA